MKKVLEFWEQRYREDNTPWDAEGLCPILTPFAKSHKAFAAFKNSSVLIPGCGKGHEIALALKLEHKNIIAFDLSPSAITKAKTLYEQQAKKEDINLKILVADFSKDNEARTIADSGSIDLVIERAMLCALPPSLWKKYLKSLKSFLKPKAYYAGVFNIDRESKLSMEDLEGPPFPCPLYLFEKLIESLFEIEFIEEVEKGELYKAPHTFKVVLRAL